MLGMVVNQRGSERYLILDATFYKSSWRERLSEVAAEKVVTVYLKCSLETSLTRNQQRENPLPDSAVYSIYRGFELPSDPDVVVDADRVNPDEAERIVIRFLEALGNHPTSYGNSQR